MRRFANLADAGHRLAAVVRESLTTGSDAGDVATILLAVLPNGVPVALPIAAALGIRVTALDVERSDDGPRIGALPALAGARVLVIDDGVETGSVARAAAAAIRPLAPASLILAVPVCSHEAVADLGPRYDRIIAIERPFGRRALSWHFDDFDTIDAPRAWALIDAQG